MIAAQCDSGIDASRVSDTGVTPDFVFGDMAKRLRRDGAARVGTPVASTRQIAGAAATCVDVPVTGGTKQYCAFDDGVLARYVGGDLTIDAERVPADGRRVAVRRLIPTAHSSANQLPWKPTGTRCGNATDAIGAADMSLASSTTKLDRSDAASCMNVTR